MGSDVARPERPRSGWVLRQGDSKPLPHHRS